MLRRGTLASVEVWEQSLERSRRRRVLAAQGRREMARRKQASAAVSAAMVMSPTAAAFAAAGNGRVAGPERGRCIVGQPRDRAGSARRTSCASGSHRSDVVRVQSALGQNPDGIFGPRTDAAVRVFQGRNGLVVDGIVGPHTWSTLFGAHGAAYDPATPRYQFKIQRASATEEARVRPALAGRGPVAKIVLRTTPQAGRRARQSAVASSGRRSRRSTGPPSTGAPATGAPRPRPPAPVSTSCGSSRIVAPVKNYIVTGRLRRVSGRATCTPASTSQCRMGTPIVAAACGVVTQAGSSPATGTSCASSTRARSPRATRTCRGSPRTSGRACTRAR